MLRILVTSLALLSIAVSACEPPQECVEKDNWQLGVALGVGIKSNPLVDGDNIPLVVLPDIAWYGESAYFDNGELGYQWFADSSFSFETFAQIDTERAFFSFWHPANVFVPSSGFTSDVPESFPPSFDAQVSRLSIDDVAKRNWAVNGGMRLQILRQNYHWKFTWQADISQVHKGQKFGIHYTYRWSWQDWRLDISPSLIWKSENLIDYYYGIDERDNVASNQFYQGGAGWQPGILLSASKKINEHWLWLVRLDYQKLHSGMSNSPLVEEDNVHSMFVGVGYRF